MLLTDKNPTPLTTPPTPIPAKIEKKSCIQGVQHNISQRLQISPKNFMKIRSPFRNVADRHKSPTPDKYKGKNPPKKPLLSLVHV